MRGNTGNKSTGSCDVYTFDTIGILRHISAVSQLAVLFFTLKGIIKHASYLHKQHQGNYQEDVDEENQSSYVLSDCLASPMDIFVSLCEFRFRVYIML